MTRRLSFEETKNCLRAWRELGDREALELLTTCNDGLVRFIVKKYLTGMLTFDELYSAGTFGLISGINKFDYKNRAIEGFSTYISVSIENQIGMEFRNYYKHSHVLSLDQPIGYDNDGDEMRLEDILGTDSSQLIDDVISSIKNDSVREALQCLTSREKQIILLRYGLDDAHRKTQSEVAKIFGCSRPYITKQEQKALIKMRHPRNTKKLKDFIDE